MLGVGGSFVFPTATDDLTGEGKWQAGPAAVYTNLAVPNLQWGVLTYQNFSLFGTGEGDDRPDVSRLFVQPILTYQLDAGWCAAVQDDPMSFDFESGDVSIPVGPKIGHVGKLGKQPYNASVGGFYTLGEPGSGPGWGNQAQSQSAVPHERVGRRRAATRCC